MLGEKAERQQVVRLAAAHRLGELEDALGGRALQAPGSLGEQGAHAFGDVVLGEERGGVDAIRHQVAEVENRVASAGVEGSGARYASLFDGLHGVARGGLAADCSRGQWTPTWNDSRAVRYAKHQAESWWAGTAGGVRRRRLPGELRMAATLRRCDCRGLVGIGELWQAVRLGKYDIAIDLVVFAGKGGPPLRPIGAGSRPPRSGCSRPRCRWPGPP